MFKRILIIVGLLLVVSCGKKDGDNTSSSPSSNSNNTPANNTDVPVEGNDYTGIYQLKEYRCFDQNAIETARAALSYDSSSFIFNIKGNQLEQVMSNNICSVSLKRKVIFKEKNIVDFSEGFLAIKGNDPCMQKISISTVAGYDITPSEIKGYFSKSQPYNPSFQNTYIINKREKAIAFIVTNLHVFQRPHDLCLALYFLQ